MRLGLMLFLVLFSISSCFSQRFSRKMNDIEDGELKGPIKTQQTIIYKPIITISDTIIGDTLDNTGYQYYDKKGYVIETVLFNDNKLFSYHLTEYQRKRRLTKIKELNYNPDSTLHYQSNYVVHYNSKNDVDSIICDPDIRQKYRWKLAITYDKLGRVVLREHFQYGKEDGRASFEYLGDSDTLNKLTSYYSTDTTAYIHHYEYIDGLMKFSKHPNSESFYYYDENNNLIKITNKNGEHISVDIFKYDLQNRLVEKQEEKKTQTNIFYYTYYENNLLKTEKRISFLKKGEILSSSIFYFKQYDNFGNCIERFDFDGENLTRILQTNLTYY